MPSGVAVVIVLHFTNCYKLKHPTLTPLKCKCKQKCYTCMYIQNLLNVLSIAFKLANAQIFTLVREATCNSSGYINAFGRN